MTVRDRLQHAMLACLASLVVAACGGDGGPEAAAPYNWTVPELVGVLEPPAPASAPASWYFGLDAIAPAGPGAAALSWWASLQGCEACEPRQDRGFITRSVSGAWSVAPPFPDARLGFAAVGDADWAPAPGGLSVLYRGYPLGATGYRERSLQQGTWTPPRDLATPPGDGSWRGPFRSRDGSQGQLLVNGAQPAAVGFTTATGWQAPRLLPMPAGATFAQPISAAVFDDGRAIALFRLSLAPVGGDGDRLVTYRYAPGSGWDGPQDVPPGVPLTAVASVPTSPQGEAFFRGMRCTETACSITLTRYHVDGGWGEPVVLATRSRSDPEQLETGSVHVGPAGQLLVFWMDFRQVDAVQRLYRTFARLRTSQGSWMPAVQAPDPRLGADDDIHGEAVAFTAAGTARISSRLGLSSFDGTTWQVHGAAPPAKDDQYHLLDDSGQATVLWRETAGDRSRVLISRSRFP